MQSEDMSKKDYIDASAGDAALPFLYAADYAFAAAKNTIHQYDNNEAYLKKFAGIVGKFFFEGMKIKELTLSNFAFTAGTTDGYESIISILAEQFSKESKKPVILMPVPTYGLFFDQPNKAGIEIKKFDRESDGSVSAKKLDEIISQINSSDDRQVIAYFDSNPNNPTGYIRDKEATEELGEVIKKHSRKSPARIRIIDDMVYLGTEYENKKRAYSFLADEELFYDSFLLAGSSKIGLAALRSGLVIAPFEYSRKINNNVFHKQYFPSMPALYALEACFSMEENHLQQRTIFLEKLNAQHEHCGVLMKKLIDNIEGVSVVTNPHSGFFHLLDFSSLKNKFYNPQAEENGNDKALIEALEAEQVKLCAGRLTGLSIEKMIYRTSFAFPQEKVIELAERIKKVIQ